jgi:hypothetical protein
MADNWINTPQDTVINGFIDAAEYLYGHCPGYYDHDPQYPPMGQLHPYRGF